MDIPLLYFLFLIYICLMWFCPDSRSSISKSSDLISGVSFGKPKFLGSKSGCFLRIRFPTSPRYAQPFSSARSVIDDEISLFTILAGDSGSITSAFFFLTTGLPFFLGSGKGSCTEDDEVIISR